MRGLIARLATVVVACVLASAALVVALGFAMVGVYFLFAQIASPAWAAFDSALAAIVFSLLVVGIAFLIARRPRRRLESPNPNYLAAVVGEQIGRRFQKLTGRHARASIFASFAAGFVIGASPKLREFVFDLIRRR
jgi:membrane protein implicated in regulation of membrane protease activity